MTDPHRQDNMDMSARAFLVMPHRFQQIVRRQSQTFRRHRQVKCFEQCLLPFRFLCGKQSLRYRQIRRDRLEGIKLAAARFLRVW